MANEFKIGSTLVGLALLVDMTPSITPPDYEFLTAADVIDLADGTQRGIGAPAVSWHWEVLTDAQRDLLRAFCPSHSANVFIRTLEEDGSYVNYSAVMIWPLKEKRDSGGETVTDFELIFRLLIVQV